MNLGLCIANLLRRYPAVEVPGIGVFTITHTPASYNQERSAFFPPTSHIELSEGQTDFFPLVNYVRVQRGVDEATAREMLEQAVSDVVETITRNGQALLEGVGYLVADGASFVFKPFDTGAMEVAPVTITQPEGTKEISPQIDGEESVDQVEESQIETGRSNYTAYWIAVAALILLVAVAGAIWYYKAGRHGGEENDQRMAQTTLPADTLADSAVTNQPQVKVVDSVRADTVAAVAKPPKPAVTYEIIVGSFATMAQARKYVADMKAKGYDLRALDSRMPGNRKKISWGWYATEEEAYRELARVQKNFEPGAWIAKVESD